MEVKEVLSRQYDHSWNMLEDGIEKCSESEWKKVIDDPFFVPSRLAFHIVQTADFYFGTTADEFDWKAFGFDWEEAPAEDLPGKAHIAKYIGEVKAKFSALLAEIDDDYLLGSDAPFAPYFKTPLDRLTYALRHSHHHTGQLSLDLQRRGLPEIEW